MYANKPVSEHMQELAKLRNMKTELEGMIALEESAIKSFMQTERVEELISDEHHCTLKAVTTNRLDSTALKRELPEVAARFMKSSTTTRFTFA